MYLVLAEQMQQMDRQTIETFGIPGRVLMENAGREATRFFLESFENALEQRVGVIAGRGNNGGDGFVMARCLWQKGARVTVYLLAEKSRVSGDAAANLELLAPLGLPVVEIPDPQAFSDHQTAMRHEDIWIDAILGTGLKSTVKDYFKEIIDFINATEKPVFAVDIPSGLDSDSGYPQGVCIRAAATATFAYAKVGHILFPGVDYSGNLKIVDIGIPRHVAKAVAPRQFFITPEYISGLLRSRPSQAHKGDTGHLLVLAGSPGKTGAAAMTAMSAVRAGAGLVTLGVPKSVHPVAEAQVLEAMTCVLAETESGELALGAFDAVSKLSEKKQCLALGPGIGTSPETHKLVHRILAEFKIPMVIDADGLNLLASNTRILQDMNAPVVLTPHPGEMARLAGISTKEVQADRLGCARNFATRHQVHVVLKGAATVAAHPDGSAYLNSTGNPGMASGGMGDVLTGIIAGLITQGYAPKAAAHVGVYLHGAAADHLAESIGPYGYLASEVMNEIPAQLGRCLKAV